jgi:IclR family transcriptional regulator, KDG regulon repressor
VILFWRIQDTAQISNNEISWQGIMANISGTVNKAIDVLEIFLQKDGELSLSEICKLTGYNKSTAYRLASTLVKRRFLNHVHKNGKYSLGLKMIDCGFAIRRNLKFIDLAYLYLGKLNASHDAAANLTILDEDKSLLIEEIGISSKGLPMISAAPKRLPLHASACGKILLAFMAENDRRAFYSRNTLKSLTPHTVTDVIQLESELEIIRKEEVAYDLQDYKIGLMAIASPVYNEKKEVIAAASIIVPPTRTDTGSIKQLAAVIKNCAQELSQAISNS